MKTIEINTVIDREKLSPLQWLVFALGFLVFFCDGLDTGIIGFIAPALLDDCAGCRCRDGADGAYSHLRFILAVTVTYFYRRDFFPRAHVSASVTGRASRLSVKRASFRRRTIR